MGTLVAFRLGKRRAHLHLSIASRTARRPEAAAPIGDPVTGNRGVHAGPEVGQPVAGPGGQNRRQARRVQ